ncbi:bile acid:sodium symporter family protein [Neptunomonas concharum]|uniref:Bile acid:sodium symporter family protein n=1 Tax=Neptunomonas concharum TaxID=1031538 RepID=A0A5P1RC21_9GAMM|nr:bile acid:sodium symporter family protein [Neptunomonas concharum]
MGFTVENTSLTQVVLPLALFLIMLGIGLSLRLDDFIRLRKQPGVVLLGSGLQLIGLPLLGCLLVTLFQVSGAYAAAIMILTLAPGGATSNMVSYLCRADIALSVCLTAIASIVTPFTLPILSFYVLQHWMSIETAVSFPITQTLIKLLFIALLPIFLGMVIFYHLPRWATRLQPVVKWSSLGFMILVVIGIVKSNQTHLIVLLEELGVVMIVMAALAVIISWLIAASFGFAIEQRLTLGIETGIQNAGLALIITGTVLNDAQMSGVVLLYGVLMQIPAVFLIIIRNLPQRKSPSIQN